MLKRSPAVAVAPLDDSGDRGDTAAVRGDGPKRLILGPVSIDPAVRAPALVGAYAYS
jgi:hypothetical protein